MLWQTRAYSAIGVLTLALGIGANTAIFSVVNTVLLEPLPFEAPDRIMALGQQTAQNRAALVPARSCRREAIAAGARSAG